MKITKIVLDATPRESVLSIRFSDGSDVNTAIPHDVNLKGLAELMTGFAAFCMESHLASAKIAPFLDFKGNEICEGDTVQHPDGDTGVVVFLGQHDDPYDQWRVVYDDGYPARLCLQINAGEAVVKGVGLCATYGLTCGSRCIPSGCINVNL